MEDLEEMGRKSIIKTIRSYAVILLLHLIKQQAEKRTTCSWDVSCIPFTTCPFSYPELRLIMNYL